jgi:peptidoglycan/LPS O-acetylase OafA/YrhL
VLASTLFSWLLFSTKAYTFSYLLPNMLNPVSGHPSLKDALSVGLLTFFDGSSSFNIVLWSMRPEFIGSFIAFGLALVLFRLRHSTIAAAALLGIVALLCQQTSPIFVAFPFGVALALFLPTRAQASISFPLAIAAMIFGLYLLGYSGRNIGVYTIFETSLHAPFGGRTSLFGTFHLDEITILGAALLVAVVEVSPQIRRALGIKFMAWIGELSFPLYLVHVPIISSAGTASLVWLSSTGMATGAAFAISSACSFAAAIRLLAFNRLWVVLANRISELLLSSKVGATSTSQESVREGLRAVPVYANGDTLRRRVVQPLDHYSAPKSPACDEHSRVWERWGSSLMTAAADGGRGNNGRADNRGFPSHHRCPEFSRAFSRALTVAHKNGEGSTDVTFLKNSLRRLRNWLISPIVVDAVTTQL